MMEFRRRQLSRAKLHIFSTISFALIFLIIIVADSFFSNLSLHSVVFGTKRNLQQTRSTPRPLKSTIEPLRSVKEEEVQEAYSEDDDHSHHHLVPPFHAKDKRRIARFKKNLPDFEIFKPTTLTQQFNSRVEEFFGADQCKVQFFMTWISPARSFGQREFLAMDTIFKTHPHGCLMILSTTMDSEHGYRILKPLVDRGFRVLAVTPDLSFLFKNTPAQYWFDDIKSGKKDPGEIPLAQNLSNLIRLAVLYKYGGVYLDTDFVVLKDFSGLRNSIGAQSIDVYGNWTRLNNAVLVFDKNHPLLYKFMEEFQSTFDGNKWGHNGPYLVSRVAKESQFNFTILLPMAFYPVNWSRIAGFFMQPKSRAHSRWVEAKLLQLSGATYGVHLWNRRSSSLRIEEGSIIGRLISEHCVICTHIHSS